VEDLTLEEDHLDLDYLQDQEPRLEVHCLVQHCSSGMIRVRMVEGYQTSWRLVVPLEVLEVRDLEGNLVCQDKLHSSLENTCRCQWLEDVSSNQVVLLDPLDSCCSPELH